MKNDRWSKIDDFEFPSTKRLILLWLFGVVVSAVVSIGGFVFAVWAVVSLLQAMGVL